MGLGDITLKILTDLLQGFLAVLGNKIFKTVAGLFIDHQPVTRVEL